MTASDIEHMFRQKVSEKIQIESQGIDRYAVSTPFHFSDGDHFVIVLKKKGASWYLTDEANTLMHITYQIDENRLREGTRSKIIDSVISTYQIDEFEGELIKKIPESRFGDALFDFTQALMKISDVTYLTRERIRSTFMDDFRRLLTEQIPEDRRHFDWYYEQDRNCSYRVDCRVNGMPVPLFVFALQNDDATRDATITLHQFERWGLKFKSVSIFENQESIARKVLARFSDIGDKQFSSLSARDRISSFLKANI